ncbi:Lamin protein [Spatholobus suberectus]|nr:Lamin protein [Spatholobus suberectus]
MYNVLEVNKTSYENCMDAGFIRNISRGGGRDVFQLTDAKTYYFISEGGFCWHGMKVAIHVTEGVAPTLAPSPNASDACGIQVNLILSLFIFVLIWGISSNNISY